MATIRFNTKLHDVAADVLSVVLCDPTGTYGIKSTVAGVTKVAANTAMVKDATGSYSYAYNEDVDCVSYTAWIKCTLSSRKISFHEVTWYSKASVVAAGVQPSTILAQYFIQDLALFTDPTDGNDWPLYTASMPDGLDVQFQAACLTDTTGILDGKTMSGIDYEHFGIQLRLRGATNQAGWEKASRVLNTVANVHNVSVLVSGRTFEIQNIKKASSIVFLQTDEKRRDHFSVNFVVSLKET